MSSSCISSLLLQLLYIISLGPEPGLDVSEVLGGCSGGLSGQGDLDIGGLSIPQGKEVAGRDGVNRALISDFQADLFTKLGGNDIRGGNRIGSGSSVHTDLEVFSSRSGDWDSMLDVVVDIDRR